MSAQSFTPVWDSADVDVRAIWAASGAAWLTDRRAGAPVQLVRSLVGAVRYLDAHGAGVRTLVPGDGLGLLSERAALAGSRPSGLTSAGGGTRLVPTADGWSAVTMARDDDVAMLPAWLSIEPLPSLADHWRIIEREVATRSSGDLVERAALLGLPVAAVGEITRGGIETTPYGTADPRPLAGARVVNLGSLWAGPLCGDLLARCGADLVTVESRERPDGSRRHRRFFEALHGRSRSVMVDLRDERDVERLRDLLATADVVIEGSRPRALAQLGIDAARLLVDGPPVWVSITGYGRRHGNRVGFGDDAAAGGGLVASVDGEPRFVADAVADPVSGVLAAAAAVQLLADGGRWMVDVGLASVARSMVGDWLPMSDGAPVAAPVARTDRGARMPLGRDNDALLR